MNLAKHQEVAHDYQSVPKAWARDFLWAWNALVFQGAVVRQAGRRVHCQKRQRGASQTAVYRMVSQAEPLEARLVFLRVQPEQGVSGLRLAALSLPVPQAWQRAGPLQAREPEL